MVVQFLNKQPILEVNESGSGLNRDRSPDSGWSELRNSNLENPSVKEKIEMIDISLEENKEYRRILIEDIAYTYGNDTNKFRSKLKEFGLDI